MFRIIRYLLSDTTFSSRVAGVKGPISISTIGAPQGDALSPILFIIYLDAALKEYWTKFGSGWFYILYAKDTDFISTIYTDRDYIKVTLSVTFKKWNISMNIGKPEITSL